MTALAKHLSYSDLGRAQNTSPTEPVPLRATWAPCLSDVDWRGACSLGPASDGSRWSNIEPEWCAPWAGAGPVGLRHREHMPLLFVCGIPPSPQHDWTSEPKTNKQTNKSVHHHSPMSGWKSDTEETSKQKLNRGNRLGSDPTLPTTPEKGPDISLLFLWSFFFSFFFLFFVDDGVWLFFLLFF